MGEIQTLSLPFNIPIEVTDNEDSDLWKFAMYRYVDCKT